MTAGDFLKVPDRDIVLDADTDPFPALVNRRLSFGNRKTVTDVETRLHREDDAWLQLHMMLAEPIGTDIVNIQPKPVAGSMHIQMPVASLLDQAVDLSHQKSQIHKTFHQNMHSRVMHVLGGVSGLTLSIAAS